MARELVKTVYLHTKNNKFSKDYGLKDQMQRTAVSIMANIAEGFERYSNKEFINFLNIARGSTGELRSHFYAALDLGYINEREFNKVRESCEIISRHIWNLVKYLKTAK